MVPVTAWRSESDTSLAAVPGVSCPPNRCFARSNPLAVQPLHLHLLACLLAAAWQLPLHGYLSKLAVWPL